MGYLLKTLVLSVMILSFSRYLIFNTIKPVPKATEIWWTPGTEELADDKIRPYHVTFSQELIQDLKYRLKHTRELTPPLKDVAWNYGTNTDALRELLNYWANDYNFQAREKFINQYPHFKTNIQGLDIHFLHIKPKNTQGKRVLPLLISHGWPGSVMEFYKIIPLLTTPRSEHDFVFEIIAPSMPGFGFSSSATIPGLSATNMAVVLKNLMLRLGFDKYYVQGGDYGSAINTDMSILFPQHVLGVHSNLCLTLDKWSLLKDVLYSYLPSCLSPSGNFGEGRMQPKEGLWLLLAESGYYHIQATKPDTIGVGLTDSPAGLASYIIEKFLIGTNYLYKYRADSGFLEKFTYDELIDNLMVYWSTNSITTSMRIYAEQFGTSLNIFDMSSLPVTVPTACVQFPNEIKLQPANILRQRYQNLIRVTRMPRGGHFAALEEPELFANDIWASIDEMESLKKKHKKDNSDL